LAGRGPIDGDSEAALLKLIRNELGVPAVVFDHQNVRTTILGTRVSRSTARFALDINFAAAE
jgi:flagellar biosynthesis GTPase FlhF